MVLSCAVYIFVTLDDQMIKKSVFFSKSCRDDLLWLTCDCLYASIIRRRCAWNYSSLIQAMGTLHWTIKWFAMAWNTRTMMWLQFVCFTSQVWLSSGSYGLFSQHLYGILEAENTTLVWLKATGSLHELFKDECMEFWWTPSSENYLSLLAKLTEA